MTGLPPYIDPDDVRQEGELAVLEAKGLGIAEPWTRLVAELAYIDREIAHHGSFRTNSRPKDEHAPIRG